MELTGYIKVPDFLNFIGNASYTIYLTHMSIEGLVLKAAMASGLYRAVGAHATYLIALAGTIALGCLVYALIERPIISWLQKRHKKSRQPAAAPGVEVAPLPAGSVVARNTTS
jgi:peptidoglycan/LPS O-acetylase OafA/YrhL